MTIRLWHNGVFKDETEELFPFQDRVRLGDGVFDTMLVLDGRALHEEEHIARLLHDAQVMGITCFEAAEIEDALSAMLQQHHNEITGKRFALNTLITRGASERGLKTPVHNDAQLVLKLTPVPNNFAPVHAHIARSVHRNEGSPLSRIKSINYGDNILALREAEAVGANEAVMLNNARRVTCSTSGNIYARIDGRLYTPPIKDGVLAGITRSLLIEKLEITEKSLGETDLEAAENLYISNSIRGIVPVAKLDGDIIAVHPLDTINDELFS